MTPLTSPEIELLLACVRRSPAPGDIEHARGLLNGRLDWDRVLFETSRHAVLPLLCRGLQNLDPPPEIAELLREACRRSQRRNLAVTAELLRVLRGLEAAGVPAVPFKGPVLAALAYGDLSLRTYGDLDLLVRERDLRRAREALIAEGYVPEFTFTPSQETAYIRTECALQVRHPRRDVVIELHWLLTERYLSIQLPVERFWERLEPVALGGRTVPAFAPEDLLLYLFVHGSKHRWERLEWVCSLAELIASHPSIDWNAVSRRACQAGIARLLHLGLLLCARLLGLEIPEAVREEIRKDRGVGALAAELAAAMFQPEDRARRNRGGWYLYLLRSRERWRDRARVVLFSCVRQPHPCSEELVKLPPRLSFLYFLFRPARLMSASVAAACRYCAHRARPEKRKQTQTVCTR